jgi:hypothetical protein
MTRSSAPRPKQMTKADRKFLEKVVAVLERARDVINDPATPETKVYKIGAILETFKYRRPPFTGRPKSLDF